MLKLRTIVILSIAMLPTAAGADSSDATKTTGIGLDQRDNNGQSMTSFAISGESFGRLRGGVYGHAQGDVTIGGGSKFALGFSHDNRTGVAIVGPSDLKRNSLVLGVEPVNFSLAANTEKTTEDYFEWLPMAFAGGSLGILDCQLMAGLRGGAAFGTLSKGGARGSYGAGVYADCPFVKLSGEATRIAAGDRPADILGASARLDVTRDFSLGVQGQAINTRNDKSTFLMNVGGDNSSSEKRILFSVHGTVGR